ncbi:AbrB/MazE/SpoVT family DNA-binding domain-containing protein [Mycobacterium tuberculosis]|uniref:AbrB/MazE/SpoVT family DNA-binding domain-containing protein n=1 Tax=Mycobacterium tuberculosis TaxID=1773 RepID=UPI00091D9031|nr:AbrB/MazE/SpoVT family DNA-binding domain-containing protein [Mycobacterium tuberculosis]SGI77211.1 Stage V sporulation protein T [Mycobacterium tuberculosis]
MQTGMKRPLDNMGRIVIPSEIRENLNMRIGDPVEYFIDLDDEIIVIGKYKSGCEFCDNAKEEIYYKGKFVCKVCATELKISINSFIQGTQEVATVAKMDDIGVQNDIEIRVKAKKRSKTELMINEYLRITESQPNLRQKEVAQLMGTQQARISQIKKIIENNKRLINEHLEEVSDSKLQYEKEQALKVLGKRKETRKRELMYIIERLKEKEPHLTHYQIARRLSISKSRVYQINKCIKEEKKLK